MKTQRQQQRTINSITNGRWAAYAAAAAASSFATAHSAEAAIHYSGLLHTRLSGDQSAAFPLDPAGGTLVLYHRNFVYGSYSSILGGSAFAFVYAAVSGSENGFLPSCLQHGSASVSNLHRGDPVPARPFVARGGILAQRSLNYGCWGPFRGQFLDRQRGALIGFKFNNGAGVQYGWARLKMTEFPDYDPDFPNHNIELVDYAYADPGETIVAGQMSESSAPALESLGALCLGAMGLLAWRRRRSA